MSLELINSLIVDVPDFPKPGIVFKDITPIFESGPGLKATADLFVNRWRDAGIDRLVGVESRGFLMGAPVAYLLGIGCSVVRKKGKLPRETISRSYSLEYGEATLEIHVDSLKPGQRVAIIDDLLATGGTANATVELIRELGAEVVEAGFLVDLGFLPGRSVLEAANVPVYAPLIF